MDKDSDLQLRFAAGLEDQSGHSSAKEGDLEQELEAISREIKRWSLLRQEAKSRLQDMKARLGAVEAAIRLGVGPGKKDDEAKGFILSEVLHWLDLINSSNPEDYDSAEDGDFAQGEFYAVAKELLGLVMKMDQLSQLNQLIKGFTRQECLVLQYCVQRMYEMGLGETASSQEKREASRLLTKIENKLKSAV